jgi:hypothetical protein
MQLTKHILDQVQTSTRFGTPVLINGNEFLINKSTDSLTCNYT